MAQTQDQAQNRLSMRKFCFTSTLSGPDENGYPPDPQFLKVNEVNEKRSSSDTQLTQAHRSAQIVSLSIGRFSEAALHE